MKTDLYNVKNEVVGKVELPDEVFGTKWRPELVRQVLTAYMANARSPWAHAKGRGEVRGGGRKPWRQKGTGRARHGSIRSPLWSGGGKAHGPQKERDYSQKVNATMRRSAIASVLSRKLKDREVKIFDSLALSAPKTKMFYETMRSLVGAPKGAKELSVLVVPGNGTTELSREGANVPKAKVSSPKSLNAYDLMNHRYIFLEEGAIPVIGSHYHLAP